MKDVDRGNACNEANQTGEQYQPPIMLGGKTGKYAKHAIDPSSILPTVV
jgi:hypothetical protein